MVNIVFVTTVNFDGLGDFHHLVDIYHAVKKIPHYQAYEIYCLVTTIEQPQYLYVKQYIETHPDMSHVFIINRGYSFIEFISSGADKIKKILDEAEQIIGISYDKGWARALSSFNSKIKCKTIGEHEASSDATFGNSYPLGLGPDCYGIKLRNLSRYTPVQALTEIKHENVAFVDQLLRHTKAPSIDHFCEKNIIVPAYFNQRDTFIQFVRFLAGSTDFIDKNIVIYSTGLGHGPQFRLAFNSGFKRENTEDYFSQIQQLELVEAESDSTQIIRLFREKTRTIIIMTGYYLSDQAYEALYRGAIIAGVSGDNTFELAVSCQTLPWYVSTNHHIKHPTMTGVLREIKKLDSALPQEIRESLSNYLYHVGDPTTPIMNWLKLIRYWPLVTDHLYRNCNFYDHLECILLNKEQPNLSGYTPKFFLSSVPQPDFDGKQASLHI